MGAKTVKVLHIGGRGNIEKYCAGDPYLKQLTIREAGIGLSGDAYLEAGRDAEILVADAIAPVSRELIEGMPNLKMIHSEGVAFNQIDLEAAREHGIPVCNNKGMNASAVAEQAILLMLAVLRDAVNGDEAVRTGHQIEKKMSYIKNGDLKELSDCSIGLIGFGDIAKETAARLRAFGAKDIYYNKRTRLLAEEEREYGVSFLPIDELLCRSDIVSLHLPVNSQTVCIADDRFFGKMKEGSYFINTSRGELVDDEALIRALASGKLAMAGMDTLDYEPVERSHILLTQPQEISRKIIFSPHIGGITGSSFRRGFSMVLKNIRAIEEGREPSNIVNG